MNPIIKQQEEINDLLEKLILIDIATSHSDEKIQMIKNAGVADWVKDQAVSIMSGIKNEIIETVKKEGVIGALATYLSAFYLRKHPLILIALGVLKGFGIDVGSILNSAFSALKEYWTSSGGNPDPEKAKEIINNNMPTGIVQASQEAFQELKILEKQGELHTLFITKEAGILDSVFGVFKKGKLGKSLSGSIFLWIIGFIVFTIFFEGARVAGKGTVESVTGKPSNTTPEQQNSTQNQTSTTDTSDLPATINHSLKPRTGTQYHINNENTSWFVPLISNSIEKTMLVWVKEIYPELKPFVGDISRSSEFNTIVEVLKKNYNQDHPDWLLLPIGIHTRKELVDRFIGAGLEKLQQEK
jgi:hypothetical protein